MTADEVAELLLILDGVPDPQDRRRRQAALLDSVATKTASEALEILELRRGKSGNQPNQEVPANRDF